MLLCNNYKSNSISGSCPNLEIFVVDTLLTMSNYDYPKCFKENFRKKFYIFLSDYGWVLNSVQIIMIFAFLLTSFDGCVKLMNDLGLDQIVKLKILAQMWLFVFFLRCDHCQYSMHLIYSRYLRFMF
jgi:hypothetical protein